MSALYVKFYYPLARFHKKREFEFARSAHRECVLAGQDILWVQMISLSCRMPSRISGSFKRE